MEVMCYCLLTCAFIYNHHIFLLRDSTMWSALNFSFLFILVQLKKIVLQKIK